MQSNNLFRSYTLQDYIRIKELNNPYILPKDTVDIISYVSNMVGSPNYVKTPQFLLNNWLRKLSLVINFLNYICSKIIVFKSLEIKMI